MFERICLPPKEPKGTSFDLGLLAESLIFYKDVSLILGANSLTGILEQLGPDLLLELLAEHHIQVYYIDHMFGAITKGAGTPSPIFGVGLIHAESLDLERAAHEAFARAIGKS